MMRWSVLLLLLLMLSGWVSFKELEKRWREPLALPAQGYRLTVKAGDSLRAVVNKLHREGVLAHPDLVVVYGRWTGLDQQIKRGEYLLQANTTASSLLLLLQSGKVIQYHVTLPEGITLARALDIMAQQEELQQTLEGVEDERIRALVQPHPVAEGWFFPDSYHYTRGTTDLQLLRRAHAAMLAVLEEEWRDRAPELPYDTPYQALIMASIIERETGLAQEREQIAGVFVRRLQQGMRLQTDPSVIYGLGIEFDGNLRRQHLADNSNPYNTYRHGGLPPSPIALPGRAAIHAALHPAAGSALYFVARGDGGHEFSDSLAAHTRAVRKYQLRRTQSYRSTPENN